MTNYCVSCGEPIPDGQRTCSVCYGDPYHGRDGYLLQMMEEDWQQQEYEQQRAEEEYRNQQEEK